MKIKDVLYGEFIVEPVLEELINTKEVQRLKNIHQGGANYLVNPEWNVTRYEHSVGVMLFVRLMGGSIAEQAAGLLHDISHTAFSHVVDLVVDNKEEDYHEKIFENVIENSDIPKILKKYGYNPEEILYDESKWTILERKAPKLCADRIDYTLRDMFSYGVISKEEIKPFLDSLKVVNGEVVISSIESAEWFVDLYYKEVIGLFMNPLSIYSNDRLSKAIKAALKANELTLDDLLEDDNYVFNILKESKNEEVISFVKQLNYDVKVVEDKENYDIYQVNKLRTINPGVVLEDKVYLASEKSEKVETLNKNALETCKAGTYVRIL